MVRKLTCKVVVGLSVCLNQSVSSLSEKTIPETDFMLQKACNLILRG